MGHPSRAEAQHILQEVPREKAFHFYTEIGSPTGAFATGLAEFLHVVKMVDTRSLEFHIARGDFEKWMLMLGDDTLARQLTKLREGKMNGEALRLLILQSGRLRLGLLRKAAQSAGS